MENDASRTVQNLDFPACGWRWQGWSRVGNSEAKQAVLIHSYWFGDLRDS